MITFEKSEKIFKTPFMDLINESHSVHIKYHKSNEIKASVACSVQSGGCPEDCAYCSQSTKNRTNLPKETITDINDIVAAAKRAKEMGASKFCLGAMGRRPDPEVFNLVCEAIAKIKDLELEICATMGTLNEEQTKRLKNAGCNNYNHNVDTSPEYYKKIITTRTQEERIQTINLIQKHGLKVCSGGILGMGETNEDRIKMITLLANLKEPPAIIPLNKHIKIPGTRLEITPEIDPFDFVRCIALARILMPKAMIYIAAGRESMSDVFQALCFFAGGNGIFIGDKLLTVQNSKTGNDLKLLERLNLNLAKNAN
ncbi:MAG: biotin synthase BioB [Holosporales bacterium]|jgi:biotin synthase|nr:biotin synthase BioB [Holosporales bacterium]